MTSQSALVVARGAAVTAAVVQTLEYDGWQVVRRREDITGPVHAVVYLPGLLDGGIEPDADPASELVDLVAGITDDPGPDGARVVAVGSRDWLGWPSRPRQAAAAAGLIAAVRSLALAHGRAGITVNAVVGLPEPDDEPQPVPGTHLFEPHSLTGEPVTADDIAGTVAFLVDSRSTYITGQVLQCCGGAGLLSSLSS